MKLKRISQHETEHRILGIDKKLKRIFGGGSTQGGVVAETDPIFTASEAFLFAAGDAAKLATIAAGAEVNVNADWNAVAGDALILNKPSIPTQYTDEMVDDRVAALIQNGTGITWAYNDVAGTLTPTVTITQYTDEMAQDAVGVMIGSSLQYVDATPLLDTIQDIRTTASPTFANLVITAGGEIRPSADSTTALNITKADGTTNVAYWDTTNKAYYLDTIRLHKYDPGAPANGYNTFLGVLAGNFTMTAGASWHASWNTGIGYNVLKALTTGNYNAIVGSRAGQSITGGFNNCVLGPDALRDATTPIRNVAIGSESMASATTQDSVAIGEQTMKGTSGQFNVAIGTYSMNMTTSGPFNMGVGASTLQYLTTGGSNAAIGSDSGKFNKTGDYNTAIGRESFQGVENSSDCSLNTCIGYRAGYIIQTGGNNNVLIGANCGDALTTGATNILIGFNIDAPAATTSNYLQIGNFLTGDLTGGTLVGAGLKITTPALGEKGLLVKGSASQTANLIETQDSSANIGFQVEADFDLVIGSGAANKDYTVTINGETNDGILTWMEDENWFTTNTPVHGATSLYRRYYHIILGAANPGASGATWVEAGANTTGGWRLTNAAWILRGQADIHPDWDGATDMTVGVNFMVNINNTGGGVGDTVDLRLNAYYKGLGDTATKTQAVEVATTVGQSAQYKQFRATFTLDWDAASNVIEVGDIIALVLNLETDTSEVDDIVVTSMEFFYQTTHSSIESGDV